MGISALRDFGRWKLKPLDGEAGEADCDGVVLVVVSYLFVDFYESRNHGDDLLFVACAITGDRNLYLPGSIFINREFVRGGLVENDPTGLCYGYRAFLVAAKEEILETEGLRSVLGYYASDFRSDKPESFMVGEL